MLGRSRRSVGWRYYASFPHAALAVHAVPEQQPAPRAAGAPGPALPTSLLHGASARPPPCPAGWRWPGQGRTGSGLLLMKARGCVPPAAVGAAPLRRPARCVSCARSTRCPAGCCGVLGMGPGAVLLVGRGFAISRKPNPNGWFYSRDCLPGVEQPGVIHASLLSGLWHRRCPRHLLSPGSCAASPASVKMLSACPRVPTDVSSQQKWVPFSSQQPNRGKAWLSFASGSTK